ncbi:hypothetical protein TELCIR_17285, partial [Teladorsagia circumcincta]
VISAGHKFLSLDRAKNRQQFEKSYSPVALKSVAKSSTKWSWKDIAIERAHIKKSIRVGRQRFRDRGWKLCKQVENERALPHPAYAPISAQHYSGVVHLADFLTLTHLAGAISAFVQQSDMFIGTLTAREHLRFMARMRMGSGYTTAEQNLRVDDVIRKMGLSGCADTMIGIPGSVKGLSCGEQKRLAFASEIDFDGISKWTDVFVLSAMVVIIRTIAYVALVIRAYRSR